MKILGIETSTMVGSVAITDGEGVRAELTLNSPETHATRLMPSIDYLLRGSDLALGDLDLITVATGPGSFTSLRIGISTAKSLAHVLGKPIIGVPTLDGLAAQLPYGETTLCPLLDAYGGEVYWALYRNEFGEPKRFTSYLLTSIEELMSQIEGRVIFIGEGIMPYKRFIKERLPGLALFAPPALRLPKASLVAALGWFRFQRGERDEALNLKPEYIKKSDAESKLELSGIRGQIRDE